MVGMRNMRVAPTAFAMNAVTANGVRAIICTRFHTPSAVGSRTFKPSQARVGIRSRLYSFGEMEMPDESPIPSREFLVARIEARSRAVKEGIDLNTARVNRLIDRTGGERGIGSPDGLGGEGQAVRRGRRSSPD